MVRSQDAIQYQHTQHLAAHSSDKRGHQAPETGRSNPSKPSAQNHMRSSPNKLENPQALAANLTRAALCCFEALWASISENTYIELYSAENLKFEHSVMDIQQLPKVEDSTKMSMAKEFTIKNVFSEMKARSASKRVISVGAHFESKVCGYCN